MTTAKILTFPRSSDYVAHRIKSREKHSVWIQITDSKRPKEARWYMQWPMMRAAGFRCLKGFTNVAARRGVWHEIKVRDELLRRFLLDIEDLVSLGRVQVEVDGRMVRTKIRKHA
jgi:hypothetical protein